MRYNAFKNTISSKVFLTSEFLNYCDAKVDKNRVFGSQVKQIQVYENSKIVGPLSATARLCKSCAPTWNLLHSPMSFCFSELCLFNLKVFLAISKWFWCNSRCIYWNIPAGAEIFFVCFKMHVSISLEFGQRLQKSKRDKRLSAAWKSFKAFLPGSRNFLFIIILTSFASWCSY